MGQVFKKYTTKIIAYHEYNVYFGLNIDNDSR